MTTDRADKRKTVFVVYGRNSDARRELFLFLRALHLHPLEWEQARNLTGKSTPYVGDILAAGFNAAQAAVVLLTPDDEARLREPYRHEGDGADETQFTGQPRQNVIFEAGMAMGLYEDRTIIVELGKLRQMSDVVGRHIIRLNDSPETRNDLVHRLRGAGCDVDSTGRDWYTTGKFNEVLAAIASVPQPEAKAAPLPLVPSRPVPPLSDLSENERQLLIHIRQPENDNSIAFVEDNFNVAAKKIAFGLEKLGLLERSGAEYELTTSGQAVADSLCQNTFLQFVIREARKKRNVSVETLAIEFGWALDDGMDKRELRRHITTLIQRGDLKGDEKNLQITERSLETLKREGLGE